MSHIVFGDFKATEEAILSFRKKLIESISNDVLFWCDEEIYFYPDIHRMIEENNSGDRKHTFCVTTESQTRNSEGLLFPYANYSQEELFPNGTDRSVFDEKCREILSKLLDVLRLLNSVDGIDEVRLFVTEGYDDAFEEKNTTIDELENVLLEEVRSSYSVDSSIFNLTT
jgi:hypothetical protein